LNVPDQNPTFRSMLVGLKINMAEEKGQRVILENFGRLANTQVRFFIVSGHRATPVGS